MKWDNEEEIARNLLSYINQHLSQRDMGIVETKIAERKDIDNLYRKMLNMKDGFERYEMNIILDEIDDERTPIKKMSWKLPLKVAAFILLAFLVYILIPDNPNSPGNKDQIAASAETPTDNNSKTKEPEQSTEDSINQTIEEIKNREFATEKDSNKNPNVTTIPEQKNFKNSNEEKDIIKDLKILLESLVELPESSTYAMRSTESVHVDVSEKEIQQLYDTKDLNGFLAKTSKNPDKYRYQRGLAHLNQKNYRLAIEEFNKLAEYDADYYEAQYYLIISNAGIYSSNDDSFIEEVKEYIDDSDNQYIDKVKEIYEILIRD